MTAPRKLLTAWNLQAHKALGQNFLVNPAVAEQIVLQAGIGAEDVVLEIGAGLGALTVPAARRANSVVAVERDRRLIPLLRAELLANGIDNVAVVEHDILTLDINALAAAYGERLTAMGNLPYNISSQVVVKLMGHRQHIDRAVLMFQKELAQRLCAGPGSKTYGRLSVMLQYCADLRVLKKLAADQFHPRPKIDSTILEIAFKPVIEHPADDEKALARVVQAAFGKRRKTLRNALCGHLLQLDSDSAVAVLQQAGVEPRRRAETLTVEEFVQLADAYVRLSRKSSDTGY